MCMSPDNDAMTRRLLQPMEPVEPSMETPVLGMRLLRNQDRNE